MNSPTGFSRRGPDRVVEELAAVLCGKETFEFKALFAVVHARLKARNAASGGEEMLRLRAYEKLQTLVKSGLVAKTGKEYKGHPKPLATFIENVMAANDATIPPPAAVKPTETATATVVKEAVKRARAVKPRAAKPRVAKAQK